MSPPTPLAAVPALPLDAERTERLCEAVAGLSSAELLWASGYIAGLAGAAPEPAASPEGGTRLTVLYGSQTGNGERIARALAQNARDGGFEATVVSLADYKPSNLKREKLVTFVVSTHGEGDPPDDAELFHEFLLSTKAPKLEALKYAVLALGDSSYVNFCQTGREFDRRLAELGAERLLPIVECDLDYDEQAAAFSADVIAKLPAEIGAKKPVPHLRAVRTEATYDKRRPFAAEVLVNQKITGDGSSKDVRHIELSLEDSGIAYEPGDALAVVVDNPPELVEEIIGVLGLDADAEVGRDERRLSLGEALRSRLEVTAASLGFLRNWAEIADSRELRALFEPGREPALSEFIETHQVVDVLRQFPAGVGEADFAASLRKLSPRSYSIASSLAANPDEVHLTVAAVRYEAFGRPHWGAASTHLADRIAEGGTVSVYVEPNPRFRLPADDAMPVIMIGPGTGVAPFRAFVEERGERGATGPNWLLFGDRTFRDDFLYQLEWQRHLRQGRLDRLDVAFSRDQERKIYVQDRIRENAAELAEWIAGGAALYVCGDAKRMAGDVHDALVDVIASQSGVSRDEAESRLKALRREGRYQRDVY